MTSSQNRQTRIAARICDVLMLFLRPVIVARAYLLYHCRQRVPFIPGAHLQEWVGRAYRIHFVRGVSVIVEVLGVTRSWPVPRVNRALVIEFPSGDIAVLTSHQFRPLVIEEATPAGRRIVTSLETITVAEDSIRYDLGAAGVPMQPKDALIWHDPRFAVADEN